MFHFGKKQVSFAWLHTSISGSGKAAQNPLTLQCGGLGVSSGGSSYMCVNKPLNFSEPQFAHPQNRDENQMSVLCKL